MRMEKNKRGCFIFLLFLRCFIPLTLTLQVRKNGDGTCAPFVRSLYELLLDFTHYMARQAHRALHRDSFFFSFFFLFLLILFLLWFIFTTHIAQVNRWHLMHHCSNLLVRVICIFPDLCAVSIFFLSRKKKIPTYTWKKLKNLK